MNRFLMITATSALLCSQAFAQQAAVMPTPSLSATSPLGMVTNAPVGGTGIPLGATEIASPGVSPMPSSTAGTIGSTVCSTIGIAPSTMFGSANTFDGGGVAVGTVVPQSAMSMTGMSTSSGIAPTSALVDTSGTSSMCGAGSTNVAASSTPMSPTTPGGVSRTGIPLGSTEIGNLGVSSAAMVPTIGVAPTASTVTPIPMMPTITVQAPNMNTTAVPSPFDAAATMAPPPIAPRMTAANTMPH